MANEEAGHAADLGKWFYKIRAFPHRRIPRGARLRAFEQARSMQVRPASISSVESSSISDSAGHWTLIGPRPTADGYSGRVTAIAIHPLDANTLYVGGAEGGVWKTTDAGRNWQPLTDFQPALAIGSLAIDPTNPDVVYAGTGEANFNSDAYGGVGILKSTDGGSTWTLLASDDFEQQGIGALAIQPGNAEVILAAAAGGVYRSADGGSTWSNVLIGPASSVFFDPSNGSTAYAAISSPGPVFSGGIYKSLDGGQSWKLSAGTASHNLPTWDKMGRIALAISPSSPKTLYAGIENPSTDSTSNFLYKSTDGGNTWSQITNSSYCYKQCWYNNVLAVNPANPAMLIGGGVNLEMSSDGGTTWLPPAQAQSVHVDQHAIAFTADGSHVFVGNDGGVWSSSTTAFAWNNLNGTLALTQFYPGLSIHPSDPTISFGGSQDNNSLTYSGTLLWESVGCGDGAATAIDPVNPQNVYITCGGVSPGGFPGVIGKSTQGGQPGTFLKADAGLSATEGVPFVPYITIDPTIPQYLYFTGNQHIYQTSNGGNLWKPISPDVTTGFASPCAIAVAPGHSNTVYSGSCDGVVMITFNALSGNSSTWQNISAGLPGTAVTHLAVDYSNRTTAYATLSGFLTGHVFLTKDGGQTWTNITGNLPDIPVNDLIIDPDLPGTLYVGTDLGVFWTNNTGRVWSALGAGLPNAAVLSLAFERKSRTLRAATHGRSAWDLLVPLQDLNMIPVVSSVAPAELPLNSSNLQLTISGENFTSTSVVLWNGHQRPSTLVSAGQITATLTAADVANDSLIPISVFTPSPGGGVSQEVYVKVGPNPAIYPGGLLNAGGFLPSSGVAPGSILSIFGANLAANLATFSAVPLPTSLNGSSMTVSDPSVGFSAPAPLFYVSADQMNVQVPWELQPFDNVTFTPVFNGAAGTPVTVKAQIASPGIFTLNQSGAGQGTVTNAVTGELAAPAGNYPNSAPVKRGDYISIYCTGLGPVDNPPPNGASAPSTSLVQTLIQPTVVIGGAEAKVTFSGLAPGFVGLNQVNAQVPQNAPTGNAVPLSISDGFGDNSNTVTIAIQ